ncbi:MAG TPA: hypothetical protein VF941_09620 [Clostridia bacterium]
MPAPTTTADTPITSTTAPTVAQIPSFMELVKLNFDIKKVAIELVAYLIGLLITGALSFAVHFLAQNPDAFGLSTIIIGKVLNELFIIAKAYFSTTI